MDNTNSGTSRLTMIVFLIVALTIIAGAILLVTNRPSPVQITINPPQSTQTPLPTMTTSPLTIYVTGEVLNSAQLYTLPAGSRVEDVIQLAGGFTDTADRERVNLAALLRDGDQIHIPAIGQSVELPTVNAPLIVLINQATIEEIDTLPGIGPELASRIVEYREVNGPFADVAALDEVEGVGPSLLEAIGPLVSFE